MLKSFHHLLWFSPTLLGIIFVFANPATATVSEYRISQAVSEVSPSASNRSVAELDPSSADLSQPSSKHANPMVQFLPISQSPNASSGTALQQQSVESTAEPMEQVTSVSQLSDVQPTDWAFQALQSLVERYGCIAGYPDKTFRGNRALTRYEFAAGLNACLERINELLSAGTADLVRKEDVTVLRRLQAEFTTELTALRGRVDTLEVQTAKLESQQFSTTTKLLGNAIFGLADAFGKDGGRSHTAFQYRANLNFASSFTGRDLLLLSLFAGDAPLIDPFRLPGITAEGTLSSQFAANTNNQVQLLTTDYTFPVGEKVRVHVLSSLAPFQLFTPTLNPYLDDKDSGTGAIGVFGEYNPIYTLVGGGTGVGLNYQISPSVQLSAGYLADGLLAGNPNPGAGLFNGGYGALGQLTWKVTKRFSLAGVYINDYAPSGRFGFNYNALGVTGTGVANSLAGQDISFVRGSGLQGSPAITNGYGVQFTWQPSSKFALNGWFSTVYPRLIGKGDGNILTYALTFALPDFGKEGNLLGLVVGAEPYLTRFNGGNPQPFRVDIPLHIEGFYRYQLAEHISITPGFIWLTNPNQDSRNASDVIATIRTTFQF